MALNPLGILEQICRFGHAIKSALEKASHNAEDCRRIAELLRSLDAIVSYLHRTPHKVMQEQEQDYCSMMSSAAEGLEKALRRASELVAKFQGKGLLSGAWKADDIEKKLHEVCLDVQLNLSVVHLANGAYNNSMLDKILEIVSARPDVRLPRKASDLVQTYKKSTEYATSQNRNKRDTKRTYVDRPDVRNNGLGDNSKAAPHASLSDGLAWSVSEESLIRQYGSSTIINKTRSSRSSLPISCLSPPMHASSMIAVCPPATITEKRSSLPPKHITEKRSSLPTLCSDLEARSRASHNASLLKLGTMRSQRRPASATQLAGKTTSKNNTARGNGSHSGQRVL